MDAVEAYLGEWENYDPRSTTFRFPTDLSGNPSVTAELQNINIRQLAERMAKLENAFVGYDAWLGECLSHM